MDHKEKCRQLQAIRKGLADKLGIDLHQTECTFPGECSGTCPKCAKEEQILNAALLKKTVAVAGIAAGALSLTACGEPQIKGDVPAPVNEYDYDDYAGGLVEPIRDYGDYSPAAHILEVRPGVSFVRLSNDKYMSDEKWSDYLMEHDTYTFLDIYASVDDGGLDVVDTIIYDPDSRIAYNLDLEEVDLETYIAPGAPVPEDEINDADEAEVEETVETAE